MQKPLMQKPNKIIARNLLGLTEDQIWELEGLYEPTEPIFITFDDKVELETDIRKTIISWYLWDLHRLYPETPLLSDHHLGTIKLESKMFIKLETKISRNLIDIYWGRVNFETLAKQIYEMNNKIHNMVVSRLSAYVETLDARDIVEIIYHQDIQEARQTMLENPTPATISELYKKVPEIISRPDFFPNNSLKQTAVTGNASVAQINQILATVGLRTDINSYMFPVPVIDSFGTGIKRFGDFLIESRSASKALLFQIDPIRETEYFNRRLQQLCQSVRYIFPGDCGTTNTLPWKMQVGDDNALTGTNYYGEDGILYSIQKGDSRTNALMGKTINIRNPLRCKYRKYGGICECCMGMLSYTIPYGTNPGHLSAYTVGEKITQAVLSIKHLDGSTEIRVIHLDPADLQYVHLSKVRSELIKINKELKDKYLDITILLPVEAVGNLTQAMQTKNLKELSIYKVSQLQTVGIHYIDDDEEVVDFATVSGPSRPSSLTTDFLEYIRRVGYSQDNPKHIEVSLKDWDFDKPAFQLPQKQINMLDFMKQFSTMIESDGNAGVKKGLDPMRDEDLVTYLRKIYEYSNSHNVHINITYLSIVTLASLVRSVADDDYRLPSDESPAEFASASAIMLHRSVGSAMAFEEQGNTIMSSKSYIKKNRSPHPMDALFNIEHDKDFFEKWGK